MKKSILFLALLTSVLSTYSQSFGIRMHDNIGVMITCPVKTASNGKILLIFSKEKDRKLIYTNYIEECKLNKNFSLYGGAGIHLGNRFVLNHKQDGYSIFLAGATVVGGIKLDLFKSTYLSADITPRVDFPIFGGCMEHKHCGEATLGNINLSMGVNF